MSPDNPFAGEAKPAQGALEAIQAGDFQRAVLALEAHLSQHPKDRQGWLILGRIMQDQDQEQLACSCLLKAFHLDPTHLETLKLLSISCTNVLDDVKSLNFLKLWMLNNKLYAHLMDPGIIPADMLTSEQVKMP